MTTPPPAPRNRTTIGVLGAGRWGMVLAQSVARTGRQVLLFARDADHAERLRTERCDPDVLPELDVLDEHVEVVTALPDVAAACNLMFVALSVTEMRPTVRRLAGSLDGAHMLVHAVRGLEPETLATPSQVIAEETCVRKIGALMGPALVEEILAGHPNAAVVASRFPEAIAATREALVSPTMRIYSNRDLVGVETASAAAHLITLAAGIERELQLGPATRAVLITRGVAEVSRLCEALGGSPATAFGLAGLGDLLVSTERESIELEAGRRLARGHSPDEIVEALGELEAFKAAQTFQALAARHQIDARITAAVHDMLFGGLAPAQALLRLMTLEQMAE